MLLIALAISLSFSSEHVDYCHRWATSDIQAVAQSEVLTFVFLRAVEAPLFGVMPLPAHTRAAYATAPMTNRPRELVCTMSSGN
jgi:hypothetical protein